MDVIETLRYCAETYPTDDDCVYRCPLNRRQQGLSGGCALRSCFVDEEKLPQHPPTDDGIIRRINVDDD